MEFLEKEDINFDDLLKEVEHAFTEVQLKDAEEIWGVVPEIVIRKKWQGKGAS